MPLMERQWLETVSTAACASREVAIFFEECPEKPSVDSGHTYIYFETRRSNRECAFKTTYRNTNYKRRTKRSVLLPFTLSYFEQKLKYLMICKIEMCVNARCCAPFVLTITLKSIGSSWPASATVTTPTFAVEVAPRGLRSPRIMLSLAL